MNKTQYSKLVFATYVFYMLISLAWFVTSLLVGKNINLYALIALGVFISFSLQMYFKIKLLNLIFGILILPSSIFFTLHLLWLGKNIGFDSFLRLMTTFSVTSIAASIVLVFGYLKLSFSNE
jgi:hypothetical protein